MKINPISNGSILGAYKVAKATTPKSAHESSLDSVSFSEDAMTFAATLSKLKEKMEAPDAARTERVAELAAKVENGTYKVDSEAVAEKILTDYIF